MSLRTTSGPEIAPRSAKVGQPVAIRAKIENKAAQAARVACRAELVEGALRRPMDFPFVTEPAFVDVAPKTRQNVEFQWLAALPEGKPAHTFRGTILLCTDAGEPFARAPLDVYVSST